MRARAWSTIETDVDCVSSTLECLLAGRVARGAEALEVARVEEQAGLAAVRTDVVDLGRGAERPRRAQ
jgi:hypothetical protein